MPLTRWIYGIWLLCLTGMCFLLVSLSNRASGPVYGFVSTDKLIKQSRAYLLDQKGSKEMAEVELVSFVTHIQVHMDGLVQERTIDVLLNADIVMGGEIKDYTDLVFLHAKEDYENTLPTKNLLKTARGVN